MKWLRKRVAFQEATSRNSLIKVLRSGTNQATEVFFIIISSFAWFTLFAKLDNHKDYKAHLQLL